MTTATILLVDNGSSRPESTLNLRRIASRLGDTLGIAVHPVSLQHAHKIPRAALDGVPAQTFTPFMTRQLLQGARRFIVLPLFFGPSRALSSFIPEQVAKLVSEHGDFEIQLCPVLCPLPEGESRLAQILCDQLPPVESTQKRRVILVDHGSPIPEVTAVRRYLAAEMRRILDPDTQLQEAVMERREDIDYDFNGELLEQVLHRAGEQDTQTPIALSLLFMSPGRHAGSGGDIESICQRVREQFPDWPILTSGLIGEHEELIAILRDRLAGCLNSLTSYPGNY
jgi:sirohydrochlorin ferrochelatase